MKHFFDFKGEYFFTAGVDAFFFTVNEPDLAVRVDIPQVTAFEPAVVHGFGGFVLIFVIPLHDPFGSVHNFADLAPGNVVAVFVDNADVQDGLAYGPLLDGFRADVDAEGGDRRHFRLAEHVQDDNTGKFGEHFSFQVGRAGPGAGSRGQQGTDVIFFKIRERDDLFPARGDVGHEDRFFPVDRLQHFFRIEFAARHDNGAGITGQCRQNKGLVGSVMEVGHGRRHQADGVFISHPGRLGMSQQVTDGFFHGGIGSLAGQQLLGQSAAGQTGKQGNTG